MAKAKQPDHLWYVELSLNTPSGVFVARHQVTKEQFEAVEQQILNREPIIIFRTISGKRVLVNTSSVFTVELHHEKAPVGIIIPETAQNQIVKAGN